VSISVGITVVLNVQTIPHFWFFSSEIQDHDNITHAGSMNILWNCNNYLGIV